MLILWLVHHMHPNKRMGMLKGVVEIWSVAVVESPNRITPSLQYSSFPTTPPLIGRG